MGRSYGYMIVGYKNLKLLRSRFRSVYRVQDLVWDHVDTHETERGLLDIVLVHGLNSGKVR